MVNGDTDKKILDLHKPDQKKLKHFLSSLDDIVLAGGCFDIIHYGHVAFLSSAKKLGRSLVVLLESDETIKNKKKRKPIHNQKKRAALVASLSYVDAVLLLPVMKDDQSYLDLVRSIGPRYIAVTEGDRLLDTKKNHAAKVGADLKVVTQKIDGLSTSLITRYASISSD